VNISITVSFLIKCCYSFQRAKKLQVNICDVMDASVTGKKAMDYKVEKLLSEYTMETGKFFPRKHVLAGDLLEFLLRHIFDPPEEKTRSPRTFTKK
jgi:hypothetical protein